MMTKTCVYRMIVLEHVCVVAGWTGCSSDVEDCILTTFPGYSVHARIVGGDGCPLRGIELGLRVVERNQVSPAAFPNSTAPYPTSETGDIGITWGYGGWGILAECVREVELPELIAEEYRAPQIDRILLTFESDEVVHTVTLQVTDDVLPSFSPYTVNVLDFGEVLVPDVEGCADTGPGQKHRILH